MGGLRVRLAAFGAAALGLVAPAGALATWGGPASAVDGLAHASVIGSGPRVFLRPRLDQSRLPESEPVEGASHTDHPSRGLLRYGGGRDGRGVLDHPKVYLVFWGHGWSTNDPYAGYEQRFFQGLYEPGDDWTTSQSQYCEDVRAGTRNCHRGDARPGMPINGLVGGVWFDTNPLGVPTDVFGVGGGYDSVTNETIRAAEHFGNTDATSNRNAIYVINEPADRNSAGYGSAYCAYHSYVRSRYGALPYVDLPHLTDVENPKHAGVSCGQNAVNSGAAGHYDGVSIVAGHEFSETVTDPFPGHGWQDKHGKENADKCAWLDHGAGAMADLQLVTGTFAVQSLWSNTARHGHGACVLHASHRHH